MNRKSQTLFGGQWRVEGEDVVQDSRATMQPMGPVLLFGSPEWTDFDFMVDAMPYEGSGEGFKVLFRAQDGENLYGIGFGSYRNEHHDMWRVSAGHWKGLQGRCPAVPGSIEYGRWHHVRLVVRGDLYRCELDGVPLLEAVDTTYSKGRVGFSTWGTFVRFRNLEVRNARGKVLWNGLPEIQSTEQSPDHKAGKG